MESNFLNDLHKEESLGRYLDTIYPKALNGFTFKRISEKTEQFKGVDLVISRGDREYLIDEKAQLDYINSDLPTFAFEISFNKNGVEHQGWLLDDNKITDKYFLITGIFTDLNNEFIRCSITSVDRNRLIELLHKRGLTNSRIREINKNTRDFSSHGEIIIPELNPKSEGKFYYSKTNKAEEPINLILKLNFLISEGVGKKLAF